MECFFNGILWTEVVCHFLTSLVYIKHRESIWRNYNFILFYFILNREEKVSEILFEKQKEDIEGITGRNSENFITLQQLKPGDKSLTHQAYNIFYVPSFCVTLC